jgi:hypothetical protein
MIIDDVQSFSRDFINFKSFRTSGRKAKIREAYKLLTGKNFRVSCSTCYIEALMLIVNSQPMASRNYELKRGVLLQAFGDASKTCTNDTLTDELAEWYMKNQPEKIIYFSKLPPWYKVVSTPETGPAKLFQTNRNFARRNINETNIVKGSSEPPKIVIIPPKVTEAPKVIEAPAEPVAAEPKKIVRKTSKARK